MRESLNQCLVSISSFEEFCDMPARIPWNWLSKYAEGITKGVRYAVLMTEEG
jgi:hypothetical protein